MLCLNLLVVGYLHLHTLGKPSKKKNCEGSEYGPIGGGGGLEKSLLIVNLW